ncbi:hypothetical protein ACG33_07685 [Steroidobacter denitrificans]|uniref:DNA 3'-5' helicase n=1 Tax=Steroidobacter denitrificans TaxID=465721 RepID=A0A127FBK3_STEDE|nr:UvrD-helicase domain-containing protein [Steroidobacter denitrificans]AMN46978.1 hypothetical protein ACG33_07685 [Steroidobacter denitrificans]
MSSDADARRQALDPARSFIVQAPAGSGKTELLTQRYLRLLTTVQHPEQILAITFTRKAAAEMRNRILQALHGADGPAPPEEHKRTTWTLAAAVKKQDRRHGWQLADHPSRLRIQTIDALNAGLARRLPVLSGTGAALEPAEDTHPLYEAAVARLIERLGDGSAESACLETLVIHLGNRVDRLDKLLRDLLAKRDQWLHPIMNAAAHDDLRGMLEQTLSDLIERHLTQLCAELPAPLRAEVWVLTSYAAANLLRGADLPPGRRALFEACVENSASGATALEARGECLQAWLAVTEVFLRKEGQVYKSVNVRQGFPPQDTAMKSRMRETLAALAENADLCAYLALLRELPAPHYSTGQWRVLQALLTVLPLAVAELQLVFQAQGKADYLENALRALRALGTNEAPTDLALAFDYRLQHLLIDECQDTSFAQFDLLERLTAGWTPGDGRTLFCVGDPMQSIYRFRQAEVGLFLQLRRQGLRTVQLEPLRLTANFRSLRPLVEWVNQVFPSVLSPRDDPEQGAVKYSPSEAVRGAYPSSEAVRGAADANIAIHSGDAEPADQAQNGNSALTSAGLAPNQDGSPEADTLPVGVHVHAALDEDASAQALRVVHIVREARRLDPAGSIAVLVMARPHVQQIAAALSAASIDFQAIEIELLRSRPVVQDLIALTRALVHPADRTAWLAVLRAPWCGLSLADLHALVGMDRKHTINELLAQAQLENGWPEALGTQGRIRIGRVHAVLRTALHERGRVSLRDWVERTWNSLGGPACLQREQDLDDAQAFLERLEQIEVAGDLADVARLEEQLERLFARPRGEQEAQQAGPVPGPAGIELMTIHKAKGLEFDTVILPELHRRMRNEDQELLRWTRVPGHGGIVFAPLKAQDAEVDPMYRWVERLERQRGSCERARLLYVAATRARRALHLLGSVRSRQDDSGVRLVEPREGSMLRMLWGALRPRFEELTSASPVALPPVPPASGRILRRLPLSWQAPAADSAVPAQPPPLAGIDASAPDFDWVTETARHVGTLVHRELERLVRNGLAVAGGAVPADAAPRLATELAELGVPPQRCEAAVLRVFEAIENILSDARGCWLLGIGEPIQEAESELALSGVVNGRVVSSVIDRSFVDARGIRWIVDFKTSTHEGGQLAWFLDSEVERYRPQLRRYVQLMRCLHPAQPVRAALYFPLLRQWREVEV